MGNFPKVLTFCLFLTLFFQSHLSGQIIFRQLPRYEIKSSDSIFFDITSKRKIIPLNGTWKVYPVNDKQRSSAVTVPSIFSGEGDLVFEKNFSVSPGMLSNNKLRLYFLGLNYTADISVNNVIIFRHSGGEFPFQLDLPKDILNTEKDNTLRVTLSYHLDSENTIPVKQRFLFPQNFGGIFRDVYLYLTPKISVTDVELKRSFYPKSNSASLNIYAKIDNKDFDASDSVDIRFRTRIISPYSGTLPLITEEGPFTLLKNSEKIINRTLNISSPAVWSPENPSLYKIFIELLRGEEIIDIAVYETGFYSLSAAADSLLLNGVNFNFHGVTYIPENLFYGSMMTYDQMENDIRMIKSAGFNAVRFANSVPHPYCLKLCSTYGLLALIEMPADAIPGGLIEDINFMERSRNYLNGFIRPYKKYTSLAAIGLGSSIPSGSEPHINALTALAGIVKKNSSLLTYASFQGFNTKLIEGIDLYGIEIFNKSINNYIPELDELCNTIGAGRVFISSATYIVNSGNSDGYLNDHSYEAQAKFFEDLFTYHDEKPNAGFFINTMFDFRGDYSSLLGGYNSNNLYSIGIADEHRNTERIAYNIINARLNNLEKVTIPIGSKKNDSPMIFIIFGLLTALMIGVLVNSGKKFREDASRALTRPYNFYADVRDQRIISGFHTTFLAVVISAVSALLLSNVLHYLKGKLVFEKILLSFGSPGLLKLISYLSWSPLLSLLWLFIASALFLLILTIVIKFASFFVRTRVYISSVYYTVTWSFLPLVLLIPVGIVLFRILEADTVNLYVYSGLLLFTVWIFYRLMKGIYVIFDVNAGSVYFYSLLLIFLIVGGYLLYYEINNSVLEYLKLTLNQYNTGG